MYVLILLCAATYWWLAGGQEVTCAHPPVCRCFHDYSLANCAKRQLYVAPTFTTPYRRIDLRFNFIEEVPQEYQDLFLLIDLRGNTHLNCEKLINMFSEEVRHAQILSDCHQVSTNHATLPTTHLEPEKFHTTTSDGAHGNIDKPSSDRSDVDYETSTLDVNTVVTYMEKNGSYALFSKLNLTCMLLWQ